MTRLILKQPKKRVDPDFMRRIGSIGGKNSPRTGSFVYGSKRAVMAGRKGGKLSSRAGIKNGQGKRDEKSR